MNYELALKLKNAGFPKENFYITEPNAKYPKQKGQRGTPTLSELIEACEDKFLTLSHDIFKDGGHKWYSRGIISEDSVITVFAETPEGAIANLWLELNKGRIN